MWGQGEGKDQGGAKGAKEANRGQRGVSRGRFHTGFLGFPPPVGWGSEGSEQGAKGVKGSEGSKQGVKGSKQGVKGVKAFLY